MIRRCLAVMLVLVMSTEMSSAQVGRPGAPVRVRITSASGRVSGELLSISPDVLVVSSDQSRSVVRIPVSSVTRAETSRGHRSRGATAALTAVMSFVVGVGSGVLVAVATNGEGICDGCGPGLLAGIAAGAVTGVITAVKFRGERWATVPVESLSMLVPAAP